LPSLWIVKGHNGDYGWTVLWRPSEAEAITARDALLAEAQTYRERFGEAFSCPTSDASHCDRCAFRAGMMDPQFDPAESDGEDAVVEYTIEQLFEDPRAEHAWSAPLHRPPPDHNLPEPTPGHRGPIRVGDPVYLHPDGAARAYPPDHGIVNVIGVALTNPDADGALRVHVTGPISVPRDLEIGSDAIQIGSHDDRTRGDRLIVGGTVILYGGV
jgi:hypothetical protein